MSDNEGATGAQAAPGTQPLAGDAKSQADDASGDSSQQAQSESISLEEARKLRSEAKSLRKRLADIEEAATAAAEQNQTEQQKALAAARKDGAAEVMTKVQAQLRRAGVKSALITAGVNAELLDLATKDDVFAELSVNDEGDVDGLDAAIASLKKARPSLFTKVTPGDFGGGNRGATPDTKPTMTDLLRAAARG